MTQTDLTVLFLQAQELMREGKQKESMTILRKAASLGHSESARIVTHIDTLHSFTKEFPVNPLSIVDHDEVNAQHQIRNQVHLYEQDVEVNLGRLQLLNNGLIPDEISELLVYQTIDNLIEYKNKSLHILPFGVIAQVKNQIRQAFINVHIDRGHGAAIVQKFEDDLKNRIWEAGIIEKTEFYMDKLADKHFR